MTAVVVFSIIWLIIFFSFAYAVAGVIAPAKKTEVVDLASVAKEQARKLELVRTRDYEISLDDWLHYAARHILRAGWTWTYDECRRQLREYLSDCRIVYPDPGYEWTVSSAREFAQEFMSEVGETHGANQ